MRVCESNSTGPGAGMARRPQPTDGSVHVRSVRKAEPHLGLEHVALAHTAHQRAQRGAEGAYQGDAAQQPEVSVEQAARLGEGGGRRGRAWTAGHHSSRCDDFA